MILRKAWDENGGVELGTEGDSFYVVFATAPAAVAAAVQAQRELGQFDWPAGERVRVRVGIHTGNPTPHDGAYVGMDVHRAARIAAAADGGQVVVSSATAELVAGSHPAGVRLRGLGAHQLKDIARAEHLFQVTVEGLPSEFPPLRTLGAASSLPRPATPLVGRDGELAELAALLGSPRVRLVTLTGPGGSGKTRLAVALAQESVQRFTDRVYFVPLAAVTTADVMWTSIAEVLDVPPEGRIPPGFFDHVAHRSALFVLDNLEQIHGADTVVAELLDHAPQVVVIATSRRGLAVPAEHVHPVPPLGLPEGSTVTEVESSGAVQLFVQHARKVKPSFALTADNAGDVTAVCVRLDGLPLAIELAAARTRLLTPKALLARLHTALDITAHGNQTPNRQRTLRDTIAWSYDLLTADQQRFFRHLGVFAGGADLDAIAAVTTSNDDPADSGDPFDMVADLADASLLTVTETPDGEPRIGMLETVRAYALELLTVTGELLQVRERHAQYYRELAERWNPAMYGEHHLETRVRFETEHDNLREALRWALEADRLAAASGLDVHLGARLCFALTPFWTMSGYYAELQRWVEFVIERAGDVDSTELVRSLSLLAWVSMDLGQLDRAEAYAAAAVGMCRRINDTSRLGPALRVLAEIEVEHGKRDAARSTFEAALSASRASGEDWQLMYCLQSFAELEACDGRYQQFQALIDKAMELASKLQDPYFMLICEHSIASTLRRMGSVDEAHRKMRALIPQYLRENSPLGLVAVAEGYAAILADLGEHHRAVRLIGAADAMRERLATPRPATTQDDIAGAIAKIRAALGHVEWETAYQIGRDTTVENALTEADAETDDSQR